MKTVTNNYKQNIIKFGKEIDSKITYTTNGVETELGNEELNSVTPHYQADIMKSVMKQLDINSNVEIPIGTELSYQFGLKVSDAYEYIDYGNYIVFSVEKQEDTDSYKIICYDKMLYAMVDYETPKISGTAITYPITVRNYISAICSHLGLTFKNASDTFANYNRQIQSELYLDNGGNSLNYTFRDVLDELAEVTASVICINENDDELEIRYPNTTNQTIDEEWLKDVNVAFGEKFGPVNSVVLSRSAESDNVYLKDDTSIANNGLCEIKITDNQIMNWNDRSDYLPDIFSKLGGMEYYINDYSSPGITFLELYDKYNVSVGENTYNCIMLNDELNITQGMEENVNTPIPETSETDYKKADKTDRKINQTYLIVDKQNNSIEAMSSQITDQNEEIASIRLQYNELISRISDIADITTSGESSYASVNLVDVNVSQPIDIKIHPISVSISYWYPYSGLYPISALYPKSRKVRFTNTTTNEVFDWELPTDLWYYNSTTYDELELSYGDGTNSTVTVTRKCTIDSNATISVLATPTSETYSYPTSLVLTDGDYTVSLLGYDTGYLYVQLMAKNIYTTQFYTKAETNSLIDQTASSITLGVNQTLSNYSTTTEMNSAITLKANEINSVVSTKVGNDEVISKINQSAEQVTINANKISLAGKTINMTSDNVAINSTNFSVSSSGNITSSSGTIGSWTIRNDRLGTELSQPANTYFLSQSGVSAYMSNVGTKNWYLYFKDKLGIDTSGNLYANNSIMRGTIYSNSGTIGNWNINSQGIYGSSNGKTVAILPDYLEASDGYETENRTWWSIVVNAPSDIRTKNDINKLNQKYEKFYDNLIPISFKYKDDFEERKKGSIHFGFVAQDIEENIKNNNLDDLAMIYGNNLLKLNKEEIIALNTWQIQKLKKQVQEQQDIINMLIKRIEKLERESDK